jgi:hypothetical protein
MRKPARRSTSPALAREWAASERALGFRHGKPVGLPDAALDVSGTCRTGCEQTGGIAMRYLSDTNLRAVLTVLVARLGGEAVITNEELYDAMMPGGGLTERFVVEDVPGGVRVSVQDSYHAEGE